MARAYCHICQEYVNALPEGTGIVGGYTLNTPGHVHPLLLVRDRHQPHCCPHCGALLTTEQQLEQADRDGRFSEYLFWIVSAPSAALMIIGFLVYVFGGGTAFLGAGLMAAVIVLCCFVPLLIYGKNAAEGTMMFTAIIVFSLIGIFIVSADNDAQTRKRQEAWLKEYPPSTPVVEKTPDEEMSEDRKRKIEEEVKEEKRNAIAIEAAWVQRNKEASGLFEQAKIPQMATQTTTSLQADSAMQVQSGEEAGQAKMSTQTVPYVLNNMVTPKSSPNPAPAQRPPIKLHSNVDINLQLKNGTIVLRAGAEFELISASEDYARVTPIWVDANRLDHSQSYPRKYYKERLNPQISAEIPQGVEVPISNFKDYDTSGGVQQYGRVFDELH